MLSVPKACVSKKIILVVVPLDSQWPLATGGRCQVQLRPQQGPKVVLLAGAGGRSRKGRGGND